MFVKLCYQISSSLNLKDFLLNIFYSAFDGAQDQDLQALAASVVYENRLKLIAAVAGKGLDASCLLESWC